MTVLLLLLLLAGGASTDTSRARLAAVCAERGHIERQLPSLDLVALPEIGIIDLQNETLELIPVPAIHWVCERCGRQFVEPAKTDTMRIWVRGKGTRPRFITPPGLIDLYSPPAGK